MGRKILNLQDNIFSKICLLKINKLFDKHMLELFVSSYQST